MHNGNIAYWQAIKRDLAVSVRERWFAGVKGGVDSEWAFAVVLDELENMGVRAEDMEAGGNGGKEIGCRVLREAVLGAIRRVNALTRKAAAAAAATVAAAEKVHAGGVEEHEERSLLNFALTDGDSVICTRYISPPPPSSSSFANTNSISSSSPTSNKTLLLAEPASLYFSSGTSWERVNVPSSSSSSSSSSSTATASTSTSTDYTMSRPTRDSSTIIVASEPLTFERGDWVTVPRNSILTIRKQNVLMHPIVD